MIKIKIDLYLHTTVLQYLANYTKVVDIKIITTQTCLVVVHLSFRRKYRGIMPTADLVVHIRVMDYVLEYFSSM